LSAGKTLYTDVAYFKGPLSPYLNALWFRLFGVSVTTLIVCNLAILGVIVWLFYPSSELAIDRLAFRNVSPTRIVNCDWRPFRSSVH
jgi:hypothetical protein